MGEFGRGGKRPIKKPAIEDGLKSGRKTPRQSRDDRKLPQFLRAFCGNSHTVAGEVWVAAEWHPRAIDHYSRW